MGRYRAFRGAVAQTASPGSATGVVIETDFKSQSQIRAWFQISSRLLENTIITEIKPDANPDLGFNFETCSRVSAKLWLLALNLWKLFHANGNRTQHRSVSEWRVFPEEAMAQLLPKTQ